MSIIYFKSEKEIGTKVYCGNSDNTIHTNKEAISINKESVNNSHKIIEK